MGIDVIFSPDLDVIGKANGSMSSRLAVLEMCQMMGWSLIDSYTLSATTGTRKIRNHHQRSQSVYHTVEIGDSKLLSRGSGTDKCDLFSDSRLRLGMLRDFVKVPHQSFGGSFMPGRQERAADKMPVSSVQPEIDPQAHQVTHAI
jgi:hypothetical protein